MESKIPLNLNECFEQLSEIMSSSEDADWFKTSPEKEAVVQSHHGLGRWLRNNWGLWNKDTPLYQYFKTFGLWHADDMSSVILTSYHRFLNNVDINLNEQIKHYIEFWKEYEKENGPVDK